MYVAKGQGSIGLSRKSGRIVRFDKGQTFDPKEYPKGSLDGSELLEWVEKAPDAPMEENELMKLTKPQLVNMAQNKGVEITTEMKTKADLTAAILAKAEATDSEDAETGNTEEGQSEEEE
jgi:hypothetical protein